MVAVEDDDELAVRDAERVIDVARFGVVVLFALDVVDADRTGEFRKGVAASVVEQVNAELILGPVEVERGVDRGLDDLEGLVVGRNEDVDRRPRAAVLGKRAGLSVEHPADLEVAEHRHDEGVDFRGEKKHGEELKKQLEIMNSNVDFTIPMLTVTAGDDHVVSTPHTINFMRKHLNDISRPKYFNLSGAYHDLLNESDEYRNLALTYAFNFLLHGEIK